jgi:hypothetical protein
MTEQPVTCISRYESLSLPSKASPPSAIANQVNVTEEDIDIMTPTGNGDDASPVRGGGTTPSPTTAPPFFDHVLVSKKRSISLDTAHSDPDRRAESYESLTKEELIRALQSRDDVISTVDVDLDESNNKRIKTTTAVPSPSPTVSSTSSSSSPSLDEERSETGLRFFQATATTTTKKTKEAKAAVMEVVAPAVSPEQLDAKVEQFRKLAYQGIKAQITWRPSCKSGTARFVYACLCDEATFRAFLNLHEKDKTKGYKYDVAAFQKDVLRNVLMVRIRYGYLSLNGDVRVSYNKKLSEMKITGSFGV